LRPVGQAETGIVNQANEDAKFSLLRRHAEQGDARAQRLLALRYRRGRGVAQDWTEAVRWMQRAAAQGLSLAQRDLAEFYQQGVGVARDEARALELYRAAAAQGDPIAQRRLVSFPEPAP
jgi:TPR repeat protein